VQAKNSTLLRYGYTPEQAVFGRALRWPSVLTDGEEHPIAALDADPESEYTQAVQMRNTARLALISRDATDKIKRAILRKTRPERPERMLLGMRVYFWSPHPLKGRNRNDPHRWRGPATVVAPDGDSRYFLSWRGKLLLTSRDQLRLATAEEAAAADIIAEDAIITGENVHEEQDKRAVDLTDHQPVEDPNPRQEISRAIAKTRRVTIKEPLKVPIRPNFLRAQRKALADARRLLGLAVPGRKPRNPPQAEEQRIEPQEQQGAIEQPQDEEDKSMEAQAPESKPQRMIEDISPQERRWIEQKEIPVPPDGDLVLDEFHQWPEAKRRKMNLDDVPMSIREKFLGTPSEPKDVHSIKTIRL